MSERVSEEATVASAPDARGDVRRLCDSGEPLDACPLKEGE